MTTFTLKATNELSAAFTEQMARILDIIQEGDVISLEDPDDEDIVREVIKSNKELKWVMLVPSVF